MMLHGLSSIAAATGIQSPASPQPTRMDAFGTWLNGEIRSLDAELASADRSLRDFAIGKTHSIHHVMLSLESARLSFDLAVQVRNKVLEAYQEMMRMQV